MMKTRSANVSQSHVDDRGSKVVKIRLYCADRLCGARRSKRAQKQQNKYIYSETASRQIGLPG
jgi:hypothetical protein